MSDLTAWKHFIGGSWVEPAAGAYFDSPTRPPAARSTGPCGARATDVGRAVAAARDAFEDPRWRDLSQTRRGHLLRRLAPTRPGGRCRDSVDGWLPLRPKDSFVPALTTGTAVTVLELAVGTQAPAWG